MGEEEELRGAIRKTVEGDLIRPTVVPVVVIGGDPIRRYKISSLDIALYSIFESLLIQKTQHRSMKDVLNFL